jgi:hypothetical protein
MKQGDSGATFLARRPIWVSKVDQSVMDNLNPLEIAIPRYQIYNKARTFFEAREGQRMQGQCTHPKLRYKHQAKVCPDQHRATVIVYGVEIIHKEGSDGAVEKGTN